MGSSLVKIPVLLAILLAMHRSDLLDLFIIWAFARTQADRSFVSLRCATGFGSRAAWNRSYRHVGARVGSPYGRF